MFKFSFTFNFRTSIGKKDIQYCIALLVLLVLFVSSI